jgi:cytochrome c553
MKKILIFIVCLLQFFMNHTLSAQNSGEEIFKSLCAACHTIKMGRKIGPDLSGVYLIKNNEWLTQFIRSSEKLIKSGDTAAIAIYNEYNKIPMPDNQLTDEQISSIIEYIKTSDENAPVAAGQTKTNDSLASGSTQSKLPNDSLDIKYTTESLAEGIALFYGYARFTNGASPCLSCHNIKDQSVMGGGKLALDLTGAYVKLGPVGLQAIMTNPPFPAMKTAMLNHPLTENEMQQIISLLKSVGERKYTHLIPGSAGLFFFSMGFVLTLVLLAHIYLFYDNRKIT